MNEEVQVRRLLPVAGSGCASLPGNISYRSPIVLTLPRLFTSLNNTQMTRFKNSRHTCSGSVNV